ncbi:hypothetical protein CREGCYN_07840 [Synechococcus sp. M16CYN]
MTSLRTMGLLGDLCHEADYLYTRIAVIHLALKRCNNLGLQRRFYFEISVHIQRCFEMKNIVSQFKLFGFSKSCQLYLLEELIDRALTKNISIVIHNNK